MSVFSSNIDRF